MADKKTSGASMKGMHIAYGIGSLLLLITTVLVFVQDHYGRGFPKFQEIYDGHEFKRLQDEQKKADTELATGDLKSAIAQTQTELAAAEQEAAAQSAKVAEKQVEIQKIDDQLVLATRNQNFEKANFDAIKSQVDGAPSPEKREKLKSLLDEQEKKFNAAFAAAYELKIKKKADDEEKNALLQREADLKLKYDKLVSNKTDLDAKLKKAGNSILKDIEDAPGIDFIKPNRKIEQVMLNNLPFNVYFDAMSRRVDRCVTCHKAILNPDPFYQEKDLTKLEMVMRSHPRLDLFLSTTSKHPYQKFGCTICHQGVPMGTEFSRAGHSARNAAQREEWEKKYGYEKIEFWDATMYPLQYTEASCMKCHRGVDNIPEAHKLNEGRQLFRDRGCVNCHMGASGLPEMAWVGRVGPDLRRIGEKTDIQWARRWIENPWNFRPSTKMPRFFGLENRKDLSLEVEGKHIPRDPVEVEAIAAYLFTASKLREQAPAEPPAGDPEAGKRLFTVVGCVGCHASSEAPADMKFEVNHHGPDLSRVGEKLSPGWLFQWLKNPRHYWPETKMPNLRLSDKEAADLTAFLTKTMRVSKEAPKPREEFSEAAFDEIIKNKLESTIPPETLKEMLKDPIAMLEKQLKLKVKYATSGADGKLKDSGDGEYTETQIEKIKELLAQAPDKKRAAKVFYTGETLIQAYGCYGCHNIQGWTYAPLTGVNLKDEADKDLDKFDFGKSLADHSLNKNKWEWFYTKLSRPRVFDLGKLDLIHPFDRLRMPWFGYVPGSAGASHATTEGGGQEAHSHTAHGAYTAEANPDLKDSTPHGLTPHDMELLVTHLLSLTVEPIPGEMQHQPSPQELAIDRGHRVIRELNCTGCHLASAGTGPDLAGPMTLPLEAFATMLQPSSASHKFLKAPGNGIYVDEDFVSLPQEGAAETVPLNGFLNVQRGTYISGSIASIMLTEKRVHPHMLEPLEAIDFRFEKKGKGSSWVEYGSLVSAEHFAEITRVLFPDEKSAQQSYEKLKGLFVDQNAYERMAGTLALQKAGVLSSYDVEKRRGSRKFYEPVDLKVRLTRGEGRIVEPLIAAEQERLEGKASQQQAPPSLSFEGGKVQPDWLYQFLRGVHTLRPGLSVRMPSFWTDGPYSKYKVIYPAGHLSAVNPAKRDKGLGGEPLPGPEAPKVQDIPDDPSQVVEYFIHDAGQKPFGYQAAPILIEDDRKLYDLGKRVVMGTNKEQGEGLCFNCHSVGRAEQPEPKWAPNLAYAKRRLKDDWVRRFLTNPMSIYPWTNMPNNFEFDWDAYNHDLKDDLRGLMDGNMEKAKIDAEKLKAAKYFLMHSGDEELGPMGAAGK